MHQCADLSPQVKTANDAKASLPSKVAIHGTGHYLPSKVMTNGDFSKILDTSDEWITARTGIKERRIADPDESTSDLCLKASMAALENAGISADELDLIIVATMTPDYPFPATACVLQAKLGLADKHIGAFDVAAGCSGFIYGMAVARAFISSGMARSVLLVGGEVLSRVIDYTDRKSCILFGDGAGAAIVGPAQETQSGHTIVSTRLYADGRGHSILNIPAGGSLLPTSAATLRDRLHCVRLDGCEVYRFAVAAAADSIREAMIQNRLNTEDIGAIILHQANARIIESVAERLNLPRSLFVMNLDRYGNTAAASIPIALDEASHSQCMPIGKAVIMIAFGGGLTWGSAVVQW